MLLISVLVRALGAQALPSERELRRVESLTWDPVDETLRITVSLGQMKNGKYVFERLGEDYELRYAFDTNHPPTMSLKSERREFSVQEAQRMRHVFGLLANYAADSVPWWQAGEGKPVGEPKERAD